VAGLTAEHGDLGVRQEVGDEAAVDGSGDRSGRLAHDDHLGGVGIVLGEVGERGRAVDVALCWTVSAGEYSTVASPR
jgi:hypothetical protein